MPLKNTQEFIKKLESEGELKRISAEVDPVLEVTEIADRMSKTNGPALLFENIKGASFPVMINAFGSFRRMEMALGCNSFDDIGRRIESLIKIRPPGTFTQKIRMFFDLKELAGITPKKVKHAAVSAAGLRSGRTLAGYTPHSHLLATRRRSVYHPSGCHYKGP